MSSDDDVILDHYSDQADRHGLSPSSTMADEVTRSKETEAILAWVAHARQSLDRADRLLDIGCGNGHLLQELRQAFPEPALTGVDYSPEMVALAQQRDLDRCEVRRGDLRSLDLPSSSADIVVSERCLINILDRDEQIAAMDELHRVLRGGGYAILVEAFLEGLANLNRARSELGLDENVVPHHNRWFADGDMQEAVEGRFEPVEDPGADLPPRNFLSSHYFMSRVVYPATTQREVLYNTEFVKFFSFLSPRGNYSPIQLLALRHI